MQSKTKQKKMKLVLGESITGNHSVDPGVSIQLCLLQSRGYVSAENPVPVSQDHGRIRFECALNN